MCSCFNNFLVFACLIFNGIISVLWYKYNAGVPHLREGDVPPQGGRPGWAAPPDPRMGPWLRLLKEMAASRDMIPEFEARLNFSF